MDYSGYGASEQLYGYGVTNGSNIRHHDMESDDNYSSNDEYSEHTDNDNIYREVEHTNGHNRSRDFQHTHLNNSSRYCEHSDGAVPGRVARPITETSPFINNNLNVNPYVITFTLNRRNMLCVIISTVVVCAAIATGLSIFICNKDHDNVTQAHCLPWSSWSQCSTTCGVGVQTRTRQCNGNSTQPWQVTFTDSKECVERMCDAYCLPWSSWTVCSVTCGEGVQKRSRQCSGNSTKPWQITFTDSAFCAEPICLGKWLPWGPWSECSRTCGPGLKSRERGCSESYCGTNNTDVDMCQDKKCIGEWLQWGEWGSCSSTCGCGVRTRERGCSESYCGTNNTDHHICEKNADCKGNSFKPLNMGVMIVLLLSIKQFIQFNYT